MNERLSRNDRDRVIAGVCSGLADHLRVDVTVVRVLFVVFGIFSGIGILLYIILWIVMPRRDFDITTPYSSRKESYSTTPVDPEERDRRRKRDSSIAGIILILVGIIILAGRFIPHLNFRTLGALLIIGVGILLMVTAFNRRR